MIFDMKPKRYKILTALLLAVMLAVMPVSLFASVAWEDEGAAFKAQLAEHLSEMYALWIVYELEWHVEHGNLDDETLAKILEMDIMDYLADHLSAREIEEFFEMEYVDRYFFLSQNVFIAIIFSGWGTFATSSTWLPDHWDNEGQALLAQVRELVGTGLSYSFARSVDSAYEQGFGQFDSDARMRLMEWDIMAWLEQRYSHNELEVFMAKGNHARSTYLREAFFSIFVFPHQNAGSDTAESSFMAELIELLGGSVSRAGWVMDDLELLRDMGVLSAQEFNTIMYIGAEAALAHYLTPELLEEFWLLDPSDRYWFLYDSLLDSSLWAASALVPYLAPADCSQTIRETSPTTHSGIWFDTGSALRRQLEELLDDEHAVMFTSSMDVFLAVDMLDLATYTHILTLDLADVLARELISEELWHFYNTMSYFERYFILSDIVIYSAMLDWDVWDDWEQPELSPIWDDEGAPLLAQLLELVGEDNATELALYIDWWIVLGRLSDDALSEILAMDVMVALEGLLEDGLFGQQGMEELLALHYDDIAFIIFEQILQPAILDSWGFNGDFDREAVALAVETIAAYYLAEHDFDIVSLLYTADMSLDELVTVFYSLLSINEQMILWMAMDGGEAWLEEYIEEFFALFFMGSTANTIEFLQVFGLYAAIFDIFGDDIEAFGGLTVFYDIALAFDGNALDDAMLNPAFTRTLRAYGTDLPYILDFRLYEALGELFAGDGDEWPYGLVVLDALLGGLLSYNVDALYIFYTAGEPVPPPLTADDLVRFVTYWNYLTLQQENLEERMAFDIIEGTELAIDIFEMDDWPYLHLNLFFANHGDYDATFSIEIFSYGWMGSWVEHIFVVAPGSSETMQVAADMRDPAVAMVWVMIVCPDGNEINGEFALRVTEQQLP